MEDAWGLGTAATRLAPGPQCSRCLQEIRKEARPTGKRPFLNDQVSAPLAVAGAHVVLSGGTSVVPQTLPSGC